MHYEVLAGLPAPLGATASVEGVNFAVFSAHATRIDLCLFSPDGKTEIARLPLPERRGDIWHGFVPGLQPGALYGLRAHGAFAPAEGHRFNPQKLLLDPYARALHGRLRYDPVLLGADANDRAPDPRDSAAAMPKCVVPQPAGGAQNDHPRHAWSETVIYEAHVKGLTQQHPQVPAPLRGTFEGIASDPMLEHFTKLGITAVELLPVQGFLDDGFLLERGLVNYWGYNTATFFAPEARYFGPSAADGFRHMVERLHSAGIEVILDVVYNHTAEGDHRGPTLSFRGLDNASYYRLEATDPSRYVNDTGTGNTVRVSHPQVLRMVMDSLRYWVAEMGVDGFRFDLATTLGREDEGFDPEGGFFDALRQDPVLAQTKLIAEPWDIGPGGYQLGGFPAEFAEWNDAYRDAVRRFWKEDGHSAPDLAARLLGSADRFDRPGRAPQASVNFLAAHDGFTLADVTAYNKRHNKANGENNRDGHGTNHSDNCGIEGPTKDPAILARRDRRARNMLATLLLSQGTPMLLAGDEFGNSQRGNNNAYNQDNPTSWLDWAEADASLTEFVCALLAFRRAHPALRQSLFLHGSARAEDGTTDVQWGGFGAREGGPDWDDPDLDQFTVLLRGCAEVPAYARSDDVVLIVVNRQDRVGKLRLPPAREGCQWAVGIDSSAKAQKLRPLSRREIAVPALCVLALIEHPFGTAS